MKPGLYVVWRVYLTYGGGGGWGHASGRASQGAALINVSNSSKEYISAQSRHRNKQPPFAASPGQSYFPFSPYTIPYSNYLFHSDCVCGGGAIYHHLFTSSIIVASPLHPHSILVHFTG
ncbi:hypothetical protein ElyMa_005746900 [Elysia marginata]|uniref:Uncharacterized protein n=1 Tax=Elysia marginata TaxID=1093978 RepID=A0AAV4FLZ4_9GAST|nr:hypothetical protein ElyMa_005746900 [Elysia marginata]